MHALLRSVNYRKITLQNSTSGEHVQVLLRNGDFVNRPWLGFIDALDAKQLANAKPVKLVADAVNDGSGWVELRQGEHVQGCLVDAGVYAVLDSRVRILGAKKPAQTAGKSGEC